MSLRPRRVRHRHIRRFCGPSRIGRDTVTGEYRVHRDADVADRWVVEYRPIKDEGPWIFVERTIDLTYVGHAMDAHKETLR